MNRQQITCILVATSAFFLAMLACCVGSFFFHSSPTVIQKMNIGNGIEIRIIGVPQDNGFGPTVTLYEIWQNNQIKYPRMYFGDSAISAPKDSFEVLSLNNGNLVGIYQKKNPFVLHLIINLDSWEIWPRGDVKIGEKLIQQVRQYAQDDRYDFSYYSVAP